jgi:hypothetical protein
VIEFVGIVGVARIGGVDAGGKVVAGVSCVVKTRLTNMAVLTVLLGMTAFTRGAAALIPSPVVVVGLLGS